MVKHLGLNYSLAKMYARMVGWEFSPRFMLGAVIPDGLNTIGVLEGGTLAGRRASHFCGGAGLVYPQCANLKNVSSLQAWDSKFIESKEFELDSDMELFEAASKHLPEDEFKAGIRHHLLVDNEVHKYLNEIFDFSNGITCRDSGLKLSDMQFKSELDIFYRILDRFAYNQADVSLEELERLKRLFYETLPYGIARYLDICMPYGNDNFKLEDTQFFKLDEIQKLMGEANNKMLFYLESKFVSH